MYSDLFVKSEIDYRRERLANTVVRRPDRDRRLRWSRRAARVSESTS